MPSSVCISGGVKRSATVIGLLFSILLWMFGTDLTHAEEERGGLSNELYKDPKGFFIIRPPASWQPQEYPSEPRGKVGFLGPDGAELRVLVNPATADLDGFISWCQDTEKRMGMPMHIERITFGDIPAIRRTYETKGMKYRSVNVIIGNANHNLQYGAKSDKYDKYLDLVTKSMQTYEPVFQDLSSDKFKKLYASQKARLCR